MPAPRHHPSSQAASHTSIASFFSNAGSSSPLHRRSPSPELNEKVHSVGDLERGNLLSQKEALDLGVDRSLKEDLNSKVPLSTGDNKKRAISATIIEWLYSTAGFPYPIFLTSYHLGGAAVGTRLLRMFTPLMNGLDTIDMTREKYIRNILPIGVLFSGSLILSNMAYLSLSVSFIQMLKAFHPVAILLISAAFKIQNLTGRLIVIVLCISVGCAMAALGELEFEMFGFLCQASAVIFESSRLVMIQLLLQGLKMDPLCSLHYYAPICAIINACFVPFTEGWAPFLAFPKIGFTIMGLNALNAFLLNVAAVFLIGAAGGLVLTLAGVFKDILLISSSTLFFGSVISPLQIFGYIIALVGLVLFKTAGK
ncbi:hypothetical protein FFLO_04837 [Filobasidium floriforme]|uniref:Sugar phosphate transporter domain-containing protein n=1 Tax=Filobasidium floriforme TaxID=5210 RepID=A0A8K0NPI3_9TREE|nr:hypothetical protein FFLO_04837 [Filobasidium floriforme]